MRWNLWIGMTLVSAASLFGCGGGDEQPKMSERPLEKTAPPVNGATAARMGDVTPASNPTGTPAATQPTEAPKPPVVVAAVELKPMDPPPAPSAMPKVTIAAPKADESIPEDKAKDYEVKLEVKDWPVAKDGPHVHLILDDKPYKAIFEPKASVKLSEIVQGDPEIKPGHHVLVAFPSRETHISVKPEKGKSPVVVVPFWVGKKGQAPWKKTDPTLIYSRPKGEYSGAKADHIYLDFYLLNAELGDKKNAVRATVTPPSGEPKSTTLTSWIPVEIAGLPDGETKIRLELLDPAGKVVPGAYNAVDRTITIKHDSK